MTHLNFLAHNLKHPSLLLQMLIDLIKVKSDIQADKVYTCEPII